MRIYSVLQETLLINPDSVTHHRCFHRRAVHAGEEGQRTLRQESEHRLRIQLEVTVFHSLRSADIIPSFVICLHCPEQLLKMDGGRDPMTTK